MFYSQPFSRLFHILILIYNSLTIYIRYIYTPYTHHHHHHHRHHSSLTAIQLSHSHRVTYGIDRLKSQSSALFIYLPLQLSHYSYNTHSRHVYVVYTYSIIHSLTLAQAHYAASQVITNFYCRSYHTSHITPYFTLYILTIYM